MSYSRSFFKAMLDFESYFDLTDELLEKDPERLSKEEKVDYDIRKNVFKNLVRFVEIGNFTESENEKFMCLNWRLDSFDLTKAWNENHGQVLKAKGQYAQKSRATFRTQLATLSAKLYNLFETSDTEFNDMFMTIDSDWRDRLKEFNDICTYGFLGDISCQDMFSYSLFEYTDGLNSDTEFSLSECKREFRLLRLMCKDNLLSLFESCDKDKLAFLVEQMRAPLFLSGSELRVLDNGKKRYMPYLELNEFKLAFCKAFYNTSPLKLNEELKNRREEEIEKGEYVGDDSESVITDSESVVYDIQLHNDLKAVENDNVKEDTNENAEQSGVDNKVEINPKNKYGLNITQAYTDFLDRFYERNIPLENQVIDEEAINIYIDRLRHLTLVDSPRDIAKIFVIKGLKYKEYNFKQALDRLKID